jgi:hypothetical protein
MPYKVENEDQPYFVMLIREEVANIYYSDKIHPSLVHDALVNFLFLRASSRVCYF